MRVLYVTSLRPGDGKTALCAGLSMLLRQRGHSHALLKPIRLAPASEYPDPDAGFFARLQGTQAPESWPLSISFREAQDGLGQATRKHVVEGLRAAAGNSTDVIVEGPPMAASDAGILPLAAELAQALDARAVLVARYSSGLAFQELAEAAKALGPLLLGIVINGVHLYRGREVQKTLIEPLAAQGVRVLGVIPEERCLLGITVEQLAQRLGGSFLTCEERKDALVDHVMIGGWFLDWGVHYFGQSENKAVIVRGDRPDIQMAALATPTRCLVLTGGQRPIQYVEHQAREEEVPIVLVESDTLAAAKSLESLFDSATVHYPAKAECFARLLEHALDLSLLAPALGAPATGGR